MFSQVAPFVTTLEFAIISGFLVYIIIYVNPINAQGRPFFTFLVCEFVFLFIFGS